jgi:hypothetical protein
MHSKQVDPEEPGFPNQARGSAISRDQEANKELGTLEDNAPGFALI